MVDSDFLLNALLCHNYLPTTRRLKEEIPPIFCTKSFTPSVARELADLESRSGDFPGYDQIDYRLTRFNGISRLLSIPHPLPYAKLCLEIFNNWDRFEYISNNFSSKIKPQTHSDGRVIIMNGYNDSIDKASLQLDSSFGMRYRVKTDISNCFHSIYTHAVSWGLVGFVEAKSSIGRKHQSKWFNKIDKHLRACKRNETQGIAIGPAASNILAEAILTRIDENLLSQGFKFIRYIDDYCSYSETEERAEAFVRAVERKAEEFKLHLNIKKTQYSDLPQPVSDFWVVELSHHLPSEAEWSAFDVFRYLDYAVQLARLYPDGSVLKFAANVISKAKIKSMDEVKVLNYMLTLTFHRPELLPTLSNLIEAGYLNFGNIIVDAHETTKKLNSIALESAKLHRSDGMCWCLYYLGRLQAEVSVETAKMVIASEDALAILSLYWADSTCSDLILNFCNSLNIEDLYQLDRYWMLLYQMYVDGHIDALYHDKVFEILKANGVRFLLPKEAPCHN